MIVKETKAFTLIELVIGMAVIAVLMFLGLLGVSLLQKTSRDTQRTTKLAEISNIINDYKRKNQSVPDILDVTFASGKFQIRNFESLDLEGFLAPGNPTTEEKTRYFYRDVTNQNFLLCVQLESGGIKGTGTSECPPASTWQ